MGANLMYLKGGTKDHFMGFLAREFPHMVEGYGRLYAGAYAKADYVKSVRGMIDVLQRRYDVGRRPPPGTRLGAEAEAGADAAVRQSAFNWVDE
jgi:hypothetical protein